MEDFIAKQRKIYGHEHLGSLTSFGAAGPLFHVDTVRGYEENNTELLDLCFSPYLYGKILQMGPVQRDYAPVKERLKRLGNLGFVKALEIAFHDLYDSGIEDLGEGLNEKVKSNYRDYYQWYERVMEKMNCERIVRTVHPHYMCRSGSGQETERKYNIPLIRVDSLLGYPENGKINFKYFEELSGIKMREQRDFEEGIDFIFNLLDENRVVGLKQFQAYYRTLKCDRVAGEDIKDVAQLQDYLLHRIYQKADERGLVFQIHTGMANLDNSNPALLEPLFSMYPNIKFVLLHCWPFISEAAYLATWYPNVYVDTSWLVLHGEGVLEKALTEYLSMVPYERILISTDSTNLEEFYGSHIMTMNTLGRVLTSMQDKKYLTRDVCEDIVRKIMYDNHKRLYGEKPNL